MILLDTPIWVWWVNDARDLRPRQRELIEQHSAGGLRVSVISCWEVAKLIEKGRLVLNKSTGSWITAALQRPAISLLPLTPEIAVESAQLPPGFHTDPADQLLVATSRLLNLPLLTADAKILDYAHVVTLK